MTRDDMVVDKLRAALPEAIEEVSDFQGERTIFIRKDKIVDACRLLRDDPDLRYNYLSDIVADDLLPEYPRFAVSYHLLSMPNKHRIRLRVQVEDPDEGPETVAAVWPVATWLETEVWDLMGVRCVGNKGLRRLFMPEDWQGHPLRKDYPLGYEEVQFSFNWQEIDARKPRAKQ
ncbi:MAG: NADH-quinone oxidoreductase subunit C [Anaerolineae bacterium]|nr:NADH-quinone oxidoreductase subunit C [Promineifilum sp.]MCZ2113319.1 NADH-quinone oxidoreductase subunit C [Anaerolineae bacterium]